jgi:hypothetical protein
MRIGPRRLAPRTAPLGRRQAAAPAARTWLSATPALDGARRPRRAGRHRRVDLVTWFDVGHRRRT